MNNILNHICELIEQRDVLTEEFHNSQNRINILEAEIDNITGRFEEGGRLQFLVNERDRLGDRRWYLKLNIYNLNITIQSYLDRFERFMGPVGA